MNYGLSPSLKEEKHLAGLLARERTRLSTERTASSLHGTGEDAGRRVRPRMVSESGSQLDECDELEEQALQMAIDEVYGCRLGEIVLLIDSDTVVPEDCLKDAEREMAECPTVANIQHESDMMQVAHHCLENGIAYFTRRINRCVSVSAANREVVPFVGHNAFLRWKGLQDAAFVGPADGQEKMWSESNVSEGFEMALRLQMRGYIIRWATYSNGGFKEGVSLTVDHELNRWQKCAYGCNELLFNPFVQWCPIAHQIH
ncbi:glycosyl transferase family group 2-domain-containing protein [Ganoderma leucocontextum]|nr:glycosyl transferase family group 2-domain-containing protein [Ganoderma leucocontextum]KAI1794728.1 glycosyl transferase family group 2-domain-containing protein [Ganoderma leucocontextum]